MEKPVLLKGGILIDPSQKVSDRRDLLIDKGKISDIAPSLETGEDNIDIIDITGKVIAPGMVDLHVHLREPGEEEKETISDGTAAAVAGGVTSLCCMPNTTPSIDSSLIVKYIQEESLKVNLAHVYPIGSLTKRREGKEMSNYASLISAGVKAFSDDGNYIDNSMLMLNILKYLSRFDVVAISHCEDAALAGVGTAHDGYYANILGIPGIPAVAETVAVARDILLTQAVGGRLHVAHVSCAGSVELIRRAKEDGINVTAEVTPHHLLLTDEALGNFDSMAKMKPPLRTENDRQSLIQALRDGIIDIIATDHAPHTSVDKNCLFQEAAFGVTSLDFGLSLMLTELVNTGIITIEELINCYSCRPAEILGIPAGTLKKGAIADIVILDLSAEGIIDSEKFYSRGLNTPFTGRSIKGKPVMTFLEGKMKMKDGKVYV